MHCGKIHRHEYRVIYGDTDAAGVMYYGVYMRLFETGRTEYMRAVYNLSYNTLMEQEGVILPVAELYARYRAPARYDDMLVIETCLRGITRATISFEHKIRKKGIDRVLVEGHTKHAATGTDGRLCRMPDIILKAAREYMPS